MEEADSSLPHTGESEPDVKYEIYKVYLTGDRASADQVAATMLTLIQFKVGKENVAPHYVDQDDDGPFVAIPVKADRFALLNEAS